MTDAIDTMSVVMIVGIGVAVAVAYRYVERRDKLAEKTGIYPTRDWLKIIFWIWGVGGLLISIFLGLSLGVVLIWIGGTIMLGLGYLINQRR